MGETVGILLVCAMDVLVAVVVQWTTRAAAGGRLGRHGAAGIRIQATMSSDAAWTAGHRAALPWTRRIATGTALFVLAAVVLLVLGQRAAASVAALLPVVLVLVAVVPVARLATRAARAADSQ